MPLLFSDLKQPSRKGRVTAREVLEGAIIAPIDRLKTISEDDFEIITAEWAFYYLKDKYGGQVKQMGGAGDKGRDVIAFSKLGELDYYQCKHYKSPISPAGFWIEFGKLCYYTYKGEIAMPSNYIIFGQHGLGPSMLDLIDQPKSINAELINQWTKKCASIDSGKAVMTEKLKAYIMSFDFSIVSTLEPLTFLDQYGNTPMFKIRFGGGVTSPRLQIPKPKSKIQNREIRYTNPLFAVYTEELGSVIPDMESLEKADSDLFLHFGDQRDGFYSAESLERFSRDNFPDHDPTPFDEMKAEAKSVVNNVLTAKRKESGLNRLTASVSAVQTLQFASNALYQEMNVIDKCGLCHHLVVDGVIGAWIKS